jgi:hypothetical protein
MILECKTPDAIRATFLTMQQLRPHLTDPEAYGALVQQMQTDHGFRLIGFFQDNDCLGGRQRTQTVHRGWKGPD